MSGEIVEPQATIALDTNILPREGVFRNLTMSPLLKVAETRGIRLALPEVVLQESLQARRELVRSARGRLVSSFREAAKYFDLEGLYVPGEDEVIAEWDRVLREHFFVIPLRDVDAREALFREASRTLPAREGKGGRDAAIWLTLARYHAESKGITYFVSSNTKDFATKGGNLHPDLRADLEGCEEGFHYFSSLRSIFSLLSDEFPYEPSDDSFDRLREVLAVEVLAGDHLEGLNIIEGVSPEDYENLRVGRVENVKIHKAMAIDGYHIALARFNFCLDGDIFRSDGSNIWLQCVCWLELSSMHGPISGVEIEELNLLG